MSNFENFRKAIRSNDIDTVKKLVGSINLREDSSSLFDAIKSENLEIVKILLENGANANAKLGSMFSWIEYALTSALNLPDSYACNSDSMITQTMMMECNSENNAKIVQLLLDHGANLNYADLNLSQVNKFIKVKKYDLAESIYKKLIEKSPSLTLQAKAKILAEKINLFTSGSVKAIHDLDQPHTNVAWIANAMFSNFHQTEKAELPYWAKATIYTIVYSLKAVGQLKTAIKVGDGLFIDLFGENIHNNNIIIKEFLTLKTIEPLKQVLDIAALNMMDNNSYHIALIDLTKLGGSRDEVAGYYQKSDQLVALSPSLTSKMFKGTLTHELWHLAMYKIFNNDGKPYYWNGKEAKTYKIAISKTLENIYEAIYHTKAPSNLSSYQLGKLMHDDWMKYAYYAKEALFDGSSTLHKLFFLDCFLSVYSPGYKAQNEDAEFIVRYEQSVAHNIDPKLMSILKPLKEFIDTDTKPSMDNYIAHHLNKHLLKHSVTQNIDSEHNINVSGLNATEVLCSDLDC